MSARFIISTDGAALNNRQRRGSPGGCGVVIDDLVEQQRHILGYRFGKATNQQAELRAAITGLRQTPIGVDVVVLSDSAYVVELGRRLEHLRRQGWAKTTMSGRAVPLANIELLMSLHAEVGKRTVTFERVAGHSGVLVNEIADRIAGRMAQLPEYVDRDSGPVKFFSLTDSLSNPAFTDPDRLPLSEIEKYWHDVKRLASESSGGPGRRCPLSVAARQAAQNKPDTAGQQAADRNPAGDRRRRIGVDAHEGNYVEFYDRYVAEATHAVEAIRTRLLSSPDRKFLQYLFQYVTDFKFLRYAFEKCESEGGQAPGVDDVRFSDIDDDALVGMLKGLSADLRAGDYRPDALRHIELTKPDGRKRPIDIPTVRDRTAAQAIQLALAPLTDPFLTDGCIGFRQYRGPTEGWARAWNLVRNGHQAILTADLARAFTTVPKARLMEAVAKMVPDSGMQEPQDAHVRMASTTPDEFQRWREATCASMEEDAHLHALIGRLVGRVLPASRGQHQTRKRGIPQGCPLSPMLLNIYLHTMLDSKWMQVAPGWPLIRYADDLLITCPTAAEAITAERTLKESVGKAGMSMKAASVQHTRMGSGWTKWLGLEFSLADTGMVFRVPQSGWDDIAAKLAWLRTQPDGQSRRKQVLGGYINWLSPAWDEPAEVKELLRNLAKWNALDEELTTDAVLPCIEKARRQWHWLRSQRALSMTVRVAYSRGGYALPEFRSEAQWCSRGLPARLKELGVACH